MATILALILSIFVGAPHMKVERTASHDVIESFGSVNPCAGMGCR